MTSSHTTDGLSDARAREVLADARIAAGSLLGDCPEPVAIAAMLAFAKEVTPPAITTTAIAAGEFIAREAVLDAIRDRRDNGGGSASYRQACNHLVEAVSVLASAPKAASDPSISGLQPVPGHAEGCGAHDDYDCDCASPPAITTTAIAAGIKAWTSGDAAPDDWDGGAVLLRNGSTMFPSKVSLAYHANGTNRWNHQRENRNPDWDIVAYSASAPKAASEDGATGLLREAARYAEDGYRCRTCMAVFVADPKDGIGGGHPDNGCTRPNWDKLEEAAQAAAHPSTQEG